MENCSRPTRSPFVVSEKLPTSRITEACAGNMAGIATTIAAVQCKDSEKRVVLGIATKLTGFAGNIAAYASPGYSAVG